MTLRTVFAGILTAAIGLLPLAPREHVHELKAPDGHHEAVAHRHAEAHRPGHSEGHGHRTARHGETAHRHNASHAGQADTHRPVTLHRDTDHAGERHADAIDHAESVVTQIVAAFTLPEAAPVPVPAVRAPVVPAAPPVVLIVAEAPFVERLIHGPPTTPTAPRPPPSSTCL